MIDFLRGTIVHRETEYVVLDVGGVGYRVFCPNPYAIPNKEEETVLYIHHHVREDAIHLFGFPTREEQSLFRRLLDVSGIGPRVALGILAGGRPEAVIAAIMQEDVSFLTKLPGIGKKTAQRIILDLKDKLGTVVAGGGMQAAATGGGSDGSLAYAAPGGSAWAEAREALLALGYTETEADRAWQQIKAQTKESDSADVLTKLALKALYGG